MARWLLKSAIQRLISILPRSQVCNEWFQQHVTKSLGLSSSAFEAALDVCRRYIGELSVWNPNHDADFSAVELGTGWYPIVPIAMHLCGAREIWSFDIDPLLNRERLKVLMNYFCAFEADGRLQKLLPALRPERVAGLRDAMRHLETESPTAFLARFNIHARLGDARQTGLPDRSIDLFFATEVMQYVPAAVQAGLCAEFRRLAAPGAIMVWKTGLRDQFATFDRSISTLNFLQYSSAAWRWLDSPLIPQNRLRISDFRAILKQAGFRILKEENISGPSGMLDNIRLAPEFQNYAREDLLVTDTWLVSTPISNPAL